MLCSQTIALFGPFMPFDGGCLISKFPSLKSSRSWPGGIKVEWSQQTGLNQSDVYAGFPPPLSVKWFGNQSAVLWLFCFWRIISVSIACSEIETVSTNISSIEITDSKTKNRMLPWSNSNYIEFFQLCSLPPTSSIEINVSRYQCLKMRMRHLKKMRPISLHRNIFIARIKKHLNVCNRAIWKYQSALITKVYPPPKAYPPCFSKIFAEGGVNLSD